MTSHIHRLEGCAPTPLARYLKALAILRLVSAHHDPTARGFWRDEVFIIVTHLSRSDLHEFFLKEYEPTPALSLLHAESHLNEGGCALSLIEASTAPRFARLREGIALARRAPQPLFSPLELPEVDLASSTMSQLGRLFDLTDPSGSAKACAGPLLEAALYEPPTSKPATKSGQPPMLARKESARESDLLASVVNPWDLVLTFEGAETLGTVTSLRTAERGESPPMKAPIEAPIESKRVPQTTVAGATPRGEQWIALWDRPALLSEVRRFFSKGQARLARGPSPPSRGSLRRHLRLNSSRTKNALEQSEPSLSILDDIDVWSWRLRAIARNSRAPKRVVAAVREVDESLLEVVLAPEPGHWRRLLIAIGTVERLLCESPDSVGEIQRALTPVPPLRIEWLQKIDDGRAEVRLAAALASQDVLLWANHGRVSLNIRAHFVSLDRAYAARHPHGDRPDPRLVDSHRCIEDPDIVCRGTDLISDCIALVQRRVQLSMISPPDNLGMFGTAGLEASLADIAAFLSGQLDDALIASLVRPLMAIRWWRTASSHFPSPKPTGLDPAYSVVRLAYSPHPLGDDSIAIPLDPEPIARLAAGDLSGALSRCLRRLRASGFLPRPQIFAGDCAQARRLLASLAFPLRRGDLNRCLRFAIKPNEPEVQGNDRNN
jgi:CRISPR-associated protein Csx17